MRREDVSKDLLTISNIIRLFVREDFCKRMIEMILFHPSVNRSINVFSLVMPLAASPCSNPVERGLLFRFFLVLRLVIILRIGLAVLHQEFLNLLLFFLPV